MICAECGERTEDAPCRRCGSAPDLDGRWRLEAEIGRGATGTTFRGLDAATGDAVAIKEMPLGRASTDKARELVEREARVLAELDHPGIPRFVASRVVGQGRGQAVVLVQEFIDGHDLRTELETHRFTVAEVLAIMDELLGILGYLHGLSPPVIHRDLKPGNVMRRADGSLVLLDFGAVRDSIRDLDLGGSTVAGTFGYMAPEQLVGDADPASDLYALGALAVHLLSRTDPQKLLSVRGGLDWQPRVHVPRGVAMLLGDLLEPDPDVRRKRIGDTRKVRQRVQALLANPDADLPAVAAHPPPPRGGDPSGAAVVMGLSVAIALAGAVLAVVAVRTDAEQRPPVPVVVAEPPLPPPLPPPPPPVPAVQRPEDPPVFGNEVGFGDLPVMGSASAPVHIVAFSDYQCPFCARAMQTLKELLAEHEGEVAVHLRDNPLEFHRDARPAHHAVRCADEQGLAPALHWTLVEHQRDLGASALYEHASEVGVDLTAFSECMEAGRHQADIQRDLDEGRALGVRGTPTFFVNGERIVGAQPREKFEEAIARAQSLPQ